MAQWTDGVLELDQRFAIQDVGLTAPKHDRTKNDLRQGYKRRDDDKDRYSHVTVSSPQLDDHS